MAQLSGKMEADFSEFDRAVNSAIVELNSMSTAADKTAASVSNIDKSGADMGKSVAASANKAANELNTFAGGSKKTAGTIGELQTALGTADKTLGLFGVHIGPAIQALGELGSVATGTAGTLTMLAQGTLITTAAI